MVKLNTNRILSSTLGVPLLYGGKGRKPVKVSPAPAQMSAPAAGVADVKKTSAVFSWTIPDGTTNVVAQKSTTSDFASPTTLYDGAPTNQISELTGLTENTNYYVRVKVQGSGVPDSDWTTKQFKTFWTPTASSQGGNRIATADDVANTTLNPDGHLVEGDYLIVGTIGGGYTPSVGHPDPWGGTVFGANGGFLVPALGPTAKICIVGGRAWDYIQLNLRNNDRSSGSPLIITNLGGQVRCRLWLSHAKNVIVTGKYDPVAKTGSPDYLGFDDSDWTTLYGKFGMWHSGTYGDTAANIVALSGESSNVKLNYLQIGEGSFAGIVIKEDGSVLGTPVVSGTGGANTFTTSTTAVTIYSLTERVRISATTVSTSKINWIEFVGTGSTVGTYRIQAESYDAQNLATLGATSDSDGVSDMQLVTSSTSNPAYLDLPCSIPNGTYNMNIRVASAGGVTLQVKMAAIPIDTVEITDCMIHDTNGECLYGGSTQTFPQQKMKNITFKRNMCIRNGGNGFQLGNITEGCIIENNAFICSGFEWADTFQKFQDQAIQFGARKNTFTFQHNLVIGGNGESFMNYIMAPAPPDSVNLTDTVVINNNAFLRLRGYLGGFISPQSSFNGTITFTNNFIGKMGNGTYEELYDQESRLNYAILLQSVSSGQVTLNASDNKYDTSVNAGGSFAVKANPSDTNLTINDDGSNTREASLNDVEFRNFMDLSTGYDYNLIERFTATYSPRWNSTNKQDTKFETLATAGGVDISTITINRDYPVGYIVRHTDGRFYQSLVADNNATPSGNTDANWKLLVFSNGSIKPPDDVRLVDGSFYKNLSIGLESLI